MCTMVATPIPASPSFGLAWELQCFQCLAILCEQWSFLKRYPLNALLFKNWKTIQFPLDCSHVNGAIISSACPGSVRRPPHLTQEVSRKPSGGILVRCWTTLPGSFFFLFLLLLLLLSSGSTLSLSWMTELLTIFLRENLDTLQS